MKKSKRGQKENYCNIIRNAYEMKIGCEALKRVGRNKNIHGHIFEDLVRDKYNVNPVNILNGRSCQLTKSLTAPMHDLVGSTRIQCKDTVAGMRKTIQQINSGHYSKTHIVGTTETAAKAVEKTKQVVHDSGISSATTKRIAGKALGKMPTAGAVRSAAKAGGVAGAAVAAGIEAVCSIGDVISGEKDLVDAACDIAYAGAKGGAAGYAGAAAGTVAAGYAGTAIVASGIGTGLAAGSAAAAVVTFAPAVVGFGVAWAAGSLVCDVFEAIFD